MRDHLAELQQERSDLLRTANGPDFWTQAERPVVLDRIQRIDAVAERIERLVDDVERTRGNRNERRRAAFVTAHAHELRRLEIALANPEMSDAFVSVSAPVTPDGDLGGVETLARMYLGLAERWQFQADVLDDRLEPPSVDTVTLVVAGPGAAALLAGESGLHQLRQVGDDKKAVREVVRVEVLPVPVLPLDEGAINVSTQSHRRRGSTRRSTPIRVDGGTTGSYRATRALGPTTIAQTPWRTLPASCFPERRQRGRTRPASSVATTSALNHSSATPGRASPRAVWARCFAATSMSSSCHD